MAWWREDPVLLVGMHRSGTTLVARLMEDLGWFGGHHLEQNHEAVSFLELNDRLLARAHSSWDHPTPFLALLENEALVDTCSVWLAGEIDALTFRRLFLGPSRMLPGRGLPLGPWGFKDPRSTITWPVWRRVFPAMRAIHVRRHGVDVAASLRKRARAELGGEDRERFMNDDHLAQFSSTRCLDLSRAFALWEETQELFESTRLLDPGLEIHDVVYEELLANPREVLAGIAGFAGLPVDNERIELLVAEIRPDRAMAHTRDRELAEFASMREKETARWHDFRST